MKVFRLLALLALVALLLAGLILLMRAGENDMAADAVSRAHDVAPAESSGDRTLAAPMGTADVETMSAREEVAPPAPMAEQESAASAEDAAADEATHLVGRLLLPGGSPAAGASLLVHGWGANDERIRKYGRRKDWSDVVGTTDDDGRFDLAFDAPRAFQFVLDASTAGHAELSWRWSSLPRGETTDVGTQTFAAAGVIVGRIERKGGTPAGRGWRIYAESSVRAAGSDSEPTSVSAPADGTTGAFRLEGLPPGPCELQAYHRAANWIDGPTVTVRAGQETEALLVYEGEDLATRISVSTSCRPYHVFSRPVNGRVVLRDAAGQEREIERVAGSSQSYGIDGVAPGTYTVEVESEVHAPWSQSGVQPGDSVRARLVGTGRAAVTVRDAATSEPVDRYDLLVRFDEANSSPNEFQLLSAEEEPPEAGLFEGLIARPTTLVVKAPGYAPAEVSIGVPGSVARPVTVDLVRGTTIRFLVRQAGGRPAPGAVVTLHPYFEGYDPSDVFSGPTAQSARQAFRTATREQTTGADGRCSFDSVTPGEWGAWVVKGPLRKRSGKIQVAAEGELDVVLDLPGAGSLAGRVELAGDARPSGLHVFVHRSGAERPEIPWSGVSPNLVALESDGRFTLNDLPAVPHTVSLCVPSRDVPTSPNSGTSTQPIFRELGDVAIRQGQVTRETFDATGLTPGTVDVRARLNGEAAAGLVLRMTLVDEQWEWIGGVLDANGAHVLGPLFPGKWKVSLRPLAGGWAWEREVPVEVTPGSTLELLCEIELGAGRLQILDALTGEPAASRTVRLNGRKALQTDGDGWVELTLTVGSHRFQGGGADFFPGVPGGEGDQPVTVEWGPDGPLVDSIRVSFPE